MFWFWSSSLQIKAKQVPQNVWTVLCPQTPITPEKVQTEPEKFIKSLEPGNLSAPPSKKGLNMYRKKCFEKSVFWNDSLTLWKIQKETGSHQKYHFLIGLCSLGLEVISKSSLFKALFLLIPRHFWGKVGGERGFEFLLAQVKKGHQYLFVVLLKLYKSFLKGKISTCFLPMSFFSPSGTVVELRSTSHRSIKLCITIQSSTQRRRRWQMWGKQIKA